MGRHREIAQVGFINHYIRHVRHRGTTIRIPAFRIRFCKIDDRSSLTVHTHRLRKYTRRLFAPRTALIRTNGIVLARHVAFDRCRPKIIVVFLQRNNLYIIRIIERRSRAHSIIVNPHFHLFRCIGPERKTGVGRTIEAFVLHLHLLA